MMKIEDIRVGMNVRRTRDMTGRSREYPKGYTFSVVAIMNHGCSVTCDKGAIHDVTNLEPTDLEVQLTAAQAEVERIKAAIRDRDMPKVGDVITWGSGAIDYEVKAVDDGWMALKPVTTGPWERKWCQRGSMPIFKIVSRASDY